jgi:hypothetical protein
MNTTGTPKMKTKKMPKFKPTVEIIVKNEHWDDIRKYIKTLNIRHGPFLTTWKGYIVKLQVNENQELLLAMNGNIQSVEKIVANS